MVRINEIIIEEILSIIVKSGVRLAKKGEFTRTAFFNGKMDLLKAEAINKIIIRNFIRIIL